MKDLFVIACTSRADVDRLLKIIPEKLHQSLLTDETFTIACYVGNVEVIQLLWTLFDAKAQQRLVKDQFAAAIIEAAKHGKINVIVQLLQWLDCKQIESVLSFEQYNAFVYAADAGHLDILKLLYNNLSAQSKSAAIAASNFAAYRWASRNHHLEVVSFLKQVCSDEIIQKMNNAVNQPPISN